MSNNQEESREASQEMRQSNSYLLEQNTARSHQPPPANHDRNNDGTKQDLEAIEANHKQTLRHAQNKDVGRRNAEDVRQKQKDKKQQSKKAYCWIAVPMVFVTVMALAALAIAILAMHHVDILQAQLEKNTPVQLAQQTPSNGNQASTGNKMKLSAIYTRWGNSSCPETPGKSVARVYKGLMAGQQNMSGEAKGGTNFQCLPLDGVEYALPSQPGTQGENVIYGTEYSNTVKPDSNNHNVPCAVCLVSGRATIAMIPATTTCPQSWTREYYGYLMAQTNDYSTYECVDKGMEILAGTVHKENIALLAHVEASCNPGSGIECSPYIEGKELNCVVCSI